jgi:methionyl aminopeptidase
MVNSKKYHCRTNPKDGWTVTTKDGGDSAQWEHTLLVTEDGCEVLTLRPDDTIDRHIKQG